MVAEIRFTYYLISFERKSFTFQKNDYNLRFSQPKGNNLDENALINFNFKFDM